MKFSTHRPLAGSDKLVEAPRVLYTHHRMSVTLYNVGSDPRGCVQFQHCQLFSAHCKQLLNWVEMEGWKRWVVEEISNSMMSHL